MISSFLEKLNNNLYISNSLYKKVLEEDKSVVPDGFDIAKYNDAILEKEYLKYKDYFAKLYLGIDANIKLDKDQIKAILAEEDYSLIIAGAGTGKTTTMASKVKYLVDIKHVDPEKIVVMSFTKKATEELAARINLDFDIPAYVTTFHSLGLQYIREIFKDRICYVVDDTVQNEIFISYFKEKIFPYKDKVEELIKIFNPMTIYKPWVFGRYFKENYAKYNSFDEYFLVYKKDRIKEISDLKEELRVRIEAMLNGENIYTIKHELVKSKGEAIIANFLVCNGIDYEYEKVYENIMPDRKSYKPDFTLDLHGEKVYLEYFGLSNYKGQDLSRYEKIKKMKEDYHRNHHTRFIKLDYKEGERLTITLKTELEKMGFTLKPKSYKEVMDILLSHNPCSQFFPLRDFFFDIIAGIKASINRGHYQSIVHDYTSKLPPGERNMAKRQFHYVNEFYHYYQDKLFNTNKYGIDFSDMIYYANKYINIIGKNTKLDFEYLIIDEYQDISSERYEFAKNISLKNKAHIIAVGDDWQSIYSFGGSKIEYIYNFPKYFKGAKIFRINNAYRNSQKLIDYSSAFIMRNKDQITKKLVANKDIKNPIRFILYEDDEKEALKKLILAINNAHKDHKIMILGRTNKVIDNLFMDEEFKDEVGTKLTYVGYENIDIDAMTIHKSKGLTSDEVILIGLDESFPRSSNVFWLNGLFKNVEVEESIPFAEERRVFYVGLTRTKNNVYILVNKNYKKRSVFVTELVRIIKLIDVDG